ncbi:potassium uptake TrkH family protein [Arthrobacter sp. CAN_A2]|uniref:TrkH family potassium uptake protein n=1 Tax=Arthrobacter sp. CAN_A2 TaxID=2787718 RepID=UPI001A23198B
MAAERVSRTGAIERLKELRGHVAAFSSRVLTPVRLVPLAFAVVILLGAGVLELPAARASDSTDLMPALFTAVSAVCVTGLITVDPATFWSPFGQAAILAMIQVGGFGIMTLATLLALLVRKRLGIRSQLVAQSESHTVNFGDVRRVLIRVALIMGVVEGVTAVILTARFRIAYDDDLPTALWHGVFHAVSAFNNAGFSLFSDNLIPFVDDPWIIVPISIAIILGAIGFPVIIELLRRSPLSNWTIHTRLTVYGTLLLLAVGITLFAVFEWHRPETLGSLSTGGKLVAAIGGGVFPRTAGFNSINYGEAAPETLLMTDILMFIGGGSAGTAGGIKVTTFLVLGFAILNEIRGREQVTIGNRSISSSVQRQALSVALLGIGVVILGAVLLLMLTDYGLEQTLFESVSAFATVGMSTGITYDLPHSAQLVLMALMFIGRIGTITTAAALALNSKPVLYRLPEERPIIG